jgi:Pentapeptide repeats (8 copies)
LGMAVLPWLLAGVVPVVALGAWWVWWLLPIRQVELRYRLSDAKARADVEDNFRKTAGQLLGGVAVLVGAGFAYLQFQQQQTSAHDLLISNQVAKGFELLGNKEKDLSQRLGGIYALEGVMNNSEQYHQPVLEALCAFVRDRTQPHLADSVAGKVLKAITQTFSAGLPHRLQDDLSSPAADVQAALTVIGRRKSGPGRVDLVGAYIARVELGYANLRGADLRFAGLSNASLIFADLRGAYLGGAYLSGAHLNFANLSGAHLDVANLHGANLGYGDLHRANLREANLHGANLSYADLLGAKNLTQDQLDKACGENTKLDPPLTIKPCPVNSPAAGSAK